MDLPFMRHRHKEIHVIDPDSYCRGFFYVSVD
jgi:hypothetical protein